MKLFRRIHITTVLFLAILPPLDLCLGQDLINAAHEGSVEKVRAFLANGADVNAKDKKGNTALHRAAERGYRQVVELLITNGADVNARNNWAGTPLHDAANGGRREVTEILIAAGADVNAKNKYGYTPLHSAGHGSNGAVAELLIANGAGISAKAHVSHRGETPLHVAAHNYAQPVVKVMIAKGADINGKDDLGRNCLHVARGKEMIELLIAKGANVSAKDKDGKTPLHFPYGKAKGVLVLVTNGVDVNAEDNQGRTPLHIVDDRSVREAELLISEGANVNTEDIEGQTPLHVAAFKGCEKVAKLLITNGADVNVKDKDGLAALDYASNSGHKELVEMLLIAAKFTEEDKDAFWLRYKPTEKIYYYVERTFKRVEDHGQKNIEIRRQHAIIKYGKSSMLRTGVIRLTPEVHLLNEEGKWDKLRAEFWPINSRFQTGNWTDAWRWQVQVMARDYDMFPLFPGTDVKIGDSWEVTGKFKFPCFKCRIPGKITHNLEAIEIIEGIKCARIKYGFSSTLNTADHSEMLADEFVKQVKPTYIVRGEGTVYFDPEKGIIVRQDHRVEWTCRCAGKCDKKLAKSYPNYQASGERVNSSSINVKLVSEEQASRLIKEAKEAKAARSKPIAAKPVQPVGEKVSRWRYFVEKTTTERDKLTMKEKEKVFIDRAFVHYGAGAEQAGGQVKTVLQVVYIDKNQKRFPKAAYYESPLIPRNSEKFVLTEKLPLDIGSDPDFPLPVHGLLGAFDIAPVKPTVELKQELSWSSTWYVHIGWTTELTFPVTIKHEVKGYEQKKGRKCAVINYTIAGEFKTETKRKLRGEYCLKGNGTAYFDPADGIIVEKEQTVLWTRLGKQLKRCGNGAVGWISRTDEERLVRIRVSLQPD